MKKFFALIITLVLIALLAYRSTCDVKHDKASTQKVEEGLSETKKKFSDVIDSTKEKMSDSFRGAKETIDNVGEKVKETTYRAADYPHHFKETNPDEDKAYWERTKHKVSDVYHSQLNLEDEPIFGLSFSQEEKLRTSGKLKEYSAEANKIWRETKDRMAKIYEQATEHVPEETKFKITSNAISLWTAARDKISALYHSLLQSAEEEQSTIDKMKEKSSEYSEIAKEKTERAKEKVTEYMERMKDTIKPEEDKTVWEKTKEKAAQAYHKVIPDTSLFGLTPEEETHLKASGKLDQYRADVDAAWNSAKAQIAEIYKKIEDSDAQTKQTQDQLAERVSSIWSKAKAKLTSMYGSNSKKEEKEF